MSALPPLTPDQIDDSAGLLPPTAAELVAVLGVQAACALLNSRPGCTLTVPKHPGKNPAGARRWAELAAIIGGGGMTALAARWGGGVLDIPTCRALRDELRHRAIRADFDRLTRAEKLSGKAAIYEIGLRHAPITSRAIEIIVNGGGAGGFGAQASLF